MVGVEMNTYKVGVEMDTYRVVRNIIKVGYKY